MYAVIESGGKQYRVELGTQIQVDRLDVRPGDRVTLERVLLVADGEATAIGRPTVEGATVSAHVVGQDRGDKIVVFKYKPKARRRVKKGFRAELTTLRIADIAYGGRSAAKDAEAHRAEQEQAARAAEQAAAEKAAADQELAARLAADQATASEVQQGEASAQASSSATSSKKGTGSRKGRASAAAAAAGETPASTATSAEPTAPETPETAQASSADTTLAAADPPADATPDDTRKDE